MRRVFVGIAVVMLMAAGMAEASAIGFVNSPTSNSINWSNAVTALGGSINSNVNFDLMPLGSLPATSTFYLASDGVTLSWNAGANGYATIENSAGPSGAGTGGARSNGEGLHPASKYLRRSGSYVNQVTISFASAVLGVELATIDLYSRYPSNLLSITAYSGEGGNGTALGTFNGLSYNFQQNYMYGMGIISTENDIRSITLSYNNGAPAPAWGDTYGIDNILFATQDATPSAVPEPATMLLLGSGLIGIARYGRKRFEK
jgi:hypothetical protein